MLTTFLFYFFAVLLVVAALLVISLRSPIRAVFSLVLCYFAAGALWLLFEAEFLAFALILIYVGAVMVLFLFVIMMLSLNETRRGTLFVSYFPFAIIVALTMAACLITAIYQQYGGEVVVPMAVDVSGLTMKKLSVHLFTTALYPFELAGVILLVAMVAAIVLNVRLGHIKRKISSAEQVAIQREDRVSLVEVSEDSELMNKDDNT